MKNKAKSVIYYRVMGEWGVYLFTAAELDRAIDRENEGVTGKILDEADYSEAPNDK